MKKRYIIISAAALLALGTACAVLKNGGVKYMTKEITEESITQYVEASGTIKPINTIEVGTQVSGTVAQIYVDYNSVVKKGDLLAELDPSLFQANVDQSTAKLNNAQASYAKASSTLNYKRNNYQRYQHLYEKNYVSKDEVELALSNYQQAQAEVSAASAEVNAAKATLENNLTNLRYSKIVSPVDGTVISRAVDVGQTVAASFNTPTLFEVAEDLTQMQIETSVSEADIGKVKVGQKAIYTLDGYQDRKFEGEVTQVRLASTTTNNVVTYAVIISVDNSEGLVIPGMSANVSIITNKVENALCVPPQALKFTPETNGKKYEKQGIWLQTKNGLQRCDIEIGVSDDNHTQVISNEIKAGDKVVVSAIGGKKKSQSQGMRPPRI
ncbi:MAG: efflux RND transporter periplasmic adaptor subunit [Candidatus Gastranaerophilales bacterium]|nr:efflux RND transporter periplasmic adaptor subunit [Candidatus Gastranaerophilales bacterium]MCM1073378.1 efflux RND transporter periplasmic adaptor subunit [Bacteroides sp.]